MRPALLKRASRSTGVFPSQEPVVGDRQGTEGKGSEEQGGEEKGKFVAKRTTQFGDVVPSAQPQSSGRLCPPSVVRVQLEVVH